MRIVTRFKNYRKLTKQFNRRSSYISTQLGGIMLSELG